MAHVVVENVHAMPMQGLSSTFKFGMGVGIIHGVAGALRLPLTLVTPTQWKATTGSGRDKEHSRHWPSGSGRSTTGTSTGKKTPTGPKPC